MSDTNREFKVFFNGSFFGHSGRDHAGKEVRVGRWFSWAGTQWFIPAVYVCGKGFVVDFCMRVEKAQLQAFIEKWKLDGEEAAGRYSMEQQMELDRDNPLCLDFTPRLMLNGKELCSSQGCGTAYNPCLPEQNEEDAKRVVEHYGLDVSYGWMVWRYSFPKKTRRRPEVRTLSVTLKQQPVPVPGPHFHAAAPGDTFQFVFPEGGTDYTMTVQEYEQQVMEAKQFGNGRWEYPTHYHVMTYTVSPEFPGELTVADCVESDRPKEKRRNPDGPVAVAGVAIIGGADGPTALLFGGRGQGKPRIACSALHFEPVAEVEWRMVFHETHFDDITAKLI